MVEHDLHFPLADRQSQFFARPEPRVPHTTGKTGVWKPSGVQLEVALYHCWHLNNDQIFGGSYVIKQLN